MMDDNDLVALIGETQRALQSAMIQRLVQQGFDDLTPAFTTLMPLIDVEGIRQVDLAKRAKVTKQAIGHLVREMELRGYVELESDPDDARARKVRFTAKGLALRQAGFAIKRDILAAAKRELGAENHELLRQHLSYLIALMR